MAQNPPPSKSMSFGKDHNQYSYYFQESKHQQSNFLELYDRQQQISPSPAKFTPGSKPTLFPGNSGWDCAKSPKLTIKLSPTSRQQIRMASLRVHSRTRAWSTNSPHYAAVILRASIIRSSCPVSTGEEENHTYVRFHHWPLMQHLHPRKTRIGKSRDQVRNATPIALRQLARTQGSIVNVLNRDTGHSKLDTVLIDTDLPKSPLLGADHWLRDNSEQASLLQQPTNAQSSGQRKNPLLNYSSVLSAPSPSPTLQPTPAKILKEKGGGATGGL